jgi:DNA-binding MarR family transcriptional regulator
MPGSSAAFGPPLIGALLRMPWETVRERMLSGLHARGFADLNAAHLNVLQYPGPEGLRPSQLAAQTGMSKQALNYLLGQMERAGYLERRDDAADLRSTRIHLTERGHEVVRGIREIVVAVEAEWAQQLAPDRFAELRALLVELSSVTTSADPGGAGIEAPTG